MTGCGGDVGRRGRSRWIPHRLLLLDLGLSFVMTRRGRTSVALFSTTSSFLLLLAFFFFFFDLPLRMRPVDGSHLVSRTTRAGPPAAAGATAAGSGRGAVITQEFTVQLVRIGGGGGGVRRRSIF